MGQLPMESNYSEKQGGLVAARCTQAFMLGDKGNKDVLVRPKPSTLKRKP